MCHHCKRKEQEMNQPQRKLYTKAIKNFGENNQIRKAIERLTTLSLELQRNMGDKIRRKDIIDEIADVSIMLEQLKLIYDCDQEVFERIKEKEQRIKIRMIRMEE
jgi:hypothetical protein